MEFAAQETTAADAGTVYTRSENDAFTEQIFGSRWYGGEQCAVNSPSP